MKNVPNFMMAALVITILSMLFLAFSKNWVALPLGLSAVFILLASFDWVRKDNKIKGLPTEILSIYQDLDTPDQKTIVEFAEKLVNLINLRKQTAIAEEQLEKDRKGLESAKEQTAKIIERVEKQKDDAELKYRELVERLNTAEAELKSPAAL